MNWDALMTAPAPVVGLLGVLVGAVLGLTGVAVTAFFAFRNNGKNIFINTVTSERAKWRDDLRKNTAEFCKQVCKYLHKEETFDRSRLDELRVLIKLSLNPKSDQLLDKGILDAMPLLTDALDRKDNVCVSEQLNIIELSVQKLLKEVWETSKDEARDGRLVKKAGRS